MQLGQDLNKEFDLLLLERCKGSISEKRVQHDCTETFQPDHRTAKSENKKLEIYIIIVSLFSYS